MTKTTMGAVAGEPRGVQATEDLQDPGGRRNFVPRLMRYTGWSRDHALRVIAEYHRFGQLSRHCDHPVVPSVAVDWVWHLHLLDTQDYWGRYCPEVLGRPLHHIPSVGSADATRTRTHYAATLRSYTQHYGHPPDPQIWPPPARRFASRERVVDLSTHRVHPRRCWPWEQVGLILGMGLLLVPEVARAADRSQEPSLAGTLGWMLLVLLVSLWCRRVLRHAPQPRAPLPEAPITLALVASGVQRATDVLLAGMVLRGELQVVNHRLKRAMTQRPMDLECALLWDAAVKDLRPRQAALLLRPRWAIRMAHLREAGWLSPAGAEHIRLGIMVLALSALIGMFSLTWFVERPTSATSWPSLFTGWMMSIVLFQCWSRWLGATLPGRRYIKDLQHHHVRLREAPCRDELELALALFGPRVLQDTVLEPFRQLRAGGSTWHWHYSVDAGCSDGAGGGGGDGCGGCGGD